MQHNASLPTQQTVDEIGALIAAEQIEEIIYALCAGFATCPPAAQLRGFAYLLKNIITLLNFVALVTPKDPAAEEKLRQECSATSRAFVDKMVTINDWRRIKEAWRDANTSYQAVFSLDKFAHQGWEGYKKHFISLNIWEKFLLPQYKLCMGKDNVSDEELKAYFENVKKEIEDAIKIDVEKFVANHVNDEEEKKNEPDLNKRQEKLKKHAERYLKAEARDILAMMRKTSEQSPDKPLYKTLILYKNDGNEMSKLLRKYGWIFGYAGETLKFYVPKFKKLVGYIQNGVYFDKPPTNSKARSLLDAKNDAALEPSQTSAVNAPLFNLNSATANLTNKNQYLPTLAVPQPLLDVLITKVKMNELQFADVGAIFAGYFAQVTNDYTKFKVPTAAGVSTVSSPSSSSSTSNDASADSGKRKSDPGFYGSKQRVSFYQDAPKPIHVRSHSMPNLRVAMGKHS